MSPRETRKAIESLKQHRKEVTASREAAEQFLIRAKILTPSGKRLAKKYRS